MAHFAQLNDNNIVTQVIVVHNNDCQIDGIEFEEAGIVFCKKLFGPTTKWKQTSYNGTIRKNYAGIGYSYDSQSDAFIAPQPYSSWTLDEITYTWKAPIAMPQDDNLYNWDEAAQNWVLT